MYTKHCHLSDHASVIFYTTYSIMGHREAGAISGAPAVYGREAGHTPYRSPVHGTAIHTHRTNNQAHTPMGNVERPITLTIMFLDCGRKPEYLVRTYACMRRTN
ncbi:hypothetical protein CHARACLAT_029087 [Characodon lateralis]|uniref:Uncharacterized protein n=1 Tax=Characodon lateralis TaxID=208331 RepID=A0ABU7EDS1_9TELE|nr:hypothetical protein [Characodon lateralis]